MNQPQKLVSTMLDRIANRGPDNRATWSNRNSCIGHQRLSLLDLSDRGHQPMIGPQGSVITYNGEIYNYKDIRSSLEAKQYRFQSDTDTEVLVSAWEEYRDSTFRKLNGDWAFGLIDKRTGNLILSRDRYGIKPLYYIITEGYLAFASEVKALISIMSERRISRSAINQFMLFHQNENPRTTIVDDIKSVPPGTYLEVSQDGRLAESRYYCCDDLIAQNAPKTQKGAERHFGELLEDSVRLRMRADVPVGVALSGGMDSSVLAALADCVGTEAIRTFSAVFPFSEMDEGQYSAAMSEQIHSHHVAVTPRLRHFMKDFPEFVDAQDAPHHSPRAYARWYLLRAASRFVTVMIDGQGGDEIFGGYGACYRIYNEHYAKRFKAPLEMTSMPVKGEGSNVPMLGELAWDVDVRGEKKRRDRVITDIQDPFTRRQTINLQNKFLSLLHTEDRMTMAHSMEGRLPFLDHRLVEFCMSLPVKMKIRGADKYLMRQWAKNKKIVPESVINRTEKRGFSTSLEDDLWKTREGQEWFKRMVEEYEGELRKFTRIDTVNALIKEQRRGKVNNVGRLLSVMSIAVFLNKNSITVA